MPEDELQFLRRGDIIHYRIKSIRYNPVKDCFELMLISHFENYSEIKVRLNYYHMGKVSFVMSEVTDDLHYYLVNSGRKYIECITKTVTDILEETLEGASGHEECKKLKRISIF